MVETLQSRPELLTDSPFTWPWARTESKYPEHFALKNNVSPPILECPWTFGPVIKYFRGTDIGYGLMSLLHAFLKSQPLWTSCFPTSCCSPLWLGLAVPFRVRTEWLRSLLAVPLVWSRFVLQASKCSRDTIIPPTDCPSYVTLALTIRPLSLVDKCVGLLHWLLWFPCGFPARGVTKTCSCAKLLQLCPTPCDPTDCSPPGSSSVWFPQARILVKVSYSLVPDSLWPHGRYSPWDSPGQDTGVGSHSLSRGSSHPRDWIQVSRIAGGFFTSWATREAQK